jgi:outer membrane protein assembly factor BamB
MRTFAILAFWAATFGGVRAEDWPQFRGPNCSGLSPGHGLPTTFSHKDKVRWQVELGEGLASPVIVRGKVYATAMTTAKTFTVFCHDAAGGRELWRRSWDAGKLPRIIVQNTPASATPACDGKHLVVYLSTRGLIGLDAGDGRELWQHPLPVPAYLMDWGAANSPIIYNGMAIFCQDDDLLPYVVALDVATGKERWRTPRVEMLAGYSVPVLCTASGRTDLVIAGTGKLKGYDPATGREVWSCNTLLRTVMTTPVVHDGVIYVALQSYGDSARILKKALLEWLDTNQDGKLARSEVPKEFLERFDASDKNKDGFLTDDELDNAFQHPANMVGGGNTIQAVRGGGQGDVTKTHVLWNLSLPAPSNLSSPLVSNGRLLVVKQGGLSTCVETAGGKVLWERERIGNFGEYYASPVAADGKIYVAGRNGKVVVLADAPKLRVLARNDLAGEIQATPAIADGRIYVRTRQKLFCIGD